MIVRNFCSHEFRELCKTPGEFGAGSLAGTIGPRQDDGWRDVLRDWSRMGFSRPQAHFPEVSLTAGQKVRLINFPKDSCFASPDLEIVLDKLNQQL